MKKLTFIFYIPVLLLIGVVLSGYTISMLWAWFIVPTFGLPQLSIPVAIGISLLVAFLTGKIKPMDKNKEVEEDYSELLYKAFKVMFATPIFVLLIGYTLTLFM